MDKRASTMSCRGCGPNGLNSEERMPRRGEKRTVKAKAPIARFIERKARPEEGREKRSGKK